MTAMKWPSVLDIGRPKPDEQHKELISCFNSLLQSKHNDRTECANKRS